MKSTYYQPRSTKTTRRYLLCSSVLAVLLTAPLVGHSPVQAATTSSATNTKTTMIAPTADQAVTFADANLAKAVQKSFGNADQPVTMAMIKNYTGKTLTITTDSNTPITSLAGLEALQYLPSTTLIDASFYFSLSFGQNGLTPPDLTPLSNLKFKKLNLLTPYISRLDLSPLMKIDATNIEYLTLGPAESDYRQANWYGMTNAQLKAIAPWLIAIANNHFGDNHNASNWQQIVLRYNCLTDFSPLAPITNRNSNTQILAYGQLYLNDDPVTATAGEPVTFTADETKGIDGETLYPKNLYTIAAGNTWTPVTSHGDGSFTIAQPGVATINGKQYILYRQLGYPTADYTVKNYQTDGVPGNVNLELLTDALVYRRVVAPAKETTITVNYLDDTTGQTLHQEALVGKSGTTSDYQTAALIQQYLAAGYELVNDEYPTSGATFSDEDQTFNIHLKHQLQPITATKNVQQTIHYQYQDGRLAAPTVQDQLTFTRTGQKDLVTQTSSWQDWQAVTGTEFTAKISPQIKGYTADQPTVAAVPNLTAASADVTTVVTYHADAVKPTVPKPTPDPQPEPAQPLPTPIATPNHVSPAAGQQAKIALPKTGERTTTQSLASVLGVLILATLGLSAFWWQRKRKQ
ncbi:mucin-binding protein [Lapidilactobacillus wuchangensis]|uniref:mucin-binding protein n=1 Tax=Lapidilactobacillus wuchangensis TaxID=2486001 RepID=UPI000F780001|nr:MucBP domain-containing protein [Lapidilactobacillus wuchangensis]